MSDYNNKCVAHMSCLVFRGGNNAKQKAIRVQVLCIHGTQALPETSLIWHLLLRNLLRQTNKVSQIANIDAVFRQELYLVHRGALFCNVVKVREKHTC